MRISSNNTKDNIHQLFGMSGGMLEFCKLELDYLRFSNSLIPIMKFYFTDHDLEPMSEMEMPFHAILEDKKYYVTYLLMPSKEVPSHVAQEIVSSHTQKETDEGYSGVYFSKLTEKTGFLMSPDEGALLYQNMRFMDSSFKMESMIVLDVLDVKTNKTYCLEFCNHT